MMTFKQLEAVLWISQLGGFAAAARHLHTTQSAISKRVQELESAYGIQIFDRSGRCARLTGKGEEVVVLAKRLLAERDSASDQLYKAETVMRRLRIGVTELTAITWLSRFVQAIKKKYPKVLICPDVGPSVSLKEKLTGGELDLIVAPLFFQNPQVQARVIGKVRSVWMSRPGTIRKKSRYRLEELLEYNLITQSGLSGTGIIYDQWFRSRGINLQSEGAQDLLALIGMTVSGLGISYLPGDCLVEWRNRGLLEEVRVVPELPLVEYAAMLRSDQSSAFLESVVEIASQTCDFSRMFQAE